jgi:hypothetical protein
MSLPGYDGHEGDYWLGAIIALALTLDFVAVPGLAKLMDKYPYPGTAQVLTAPTENTPQPLRPSCICKNPNNRVQQIGTLKNQGP